MGRRYMSARESRILRRMRENEWRIKQRNAASAARARKENPMTDRLEELEKRAKRAVSRAEAREGRLYAHGTPLFPEDKHRELLAQIRSERNAILGEIRREAQRINAEGRAEDERLRNFQRDSILSTTERAELGDRLALARSELEGANPAQIAAKLDYLVHHGSKVERFAAWMAAKERRREFEEKGDEHAHMVFFKEFEALDQGLFEEHRDNLTAGPAATVKRAEALATYCYTRARNAKSMAGAHATYSIDPHIEKQKYDYGGRVPVATPGGTEPPTGEVAS